jgi:prephenate dehydratase
MSLKYAYLGPAGTFTQAALQKIAGSTDELIPYANVTAALNAVRSGECAKALVPIENSVEGVVARTLDELAIGEALVITAETTLPVSFSLMSLEGKDVKDIKSIATHPHAESQCREYIAKNFPSAQLIETASTAAAAKD